MWLVFWASEIPQDGDILKVKLRPQDNLIHGLQPAPVPVFAQEKKAYLKDAVQLIPRR
ncbi:hypothetical protein HispidOSU_026189, partial [Sigmodon hispidus]